MSKFYKVLGTIFIIILTGILLWGGFFILTNNTVFQGLTKNLPGLSPLGKVNLPGKLLGPKLPQKAETLDPDKIIEWTNFYREQEGLDKLIANVNLAQAASDKVEDMFQKQYFEHVSPTGVSPDQLVLAAGYNYKVTGENLALGDFKDEKDLVDAWMASPGHRANILNPDYSEIGVASDLDEFEDRGKTWLSVQEFGDPAPNCQKPSSSLAQEIENKKAEYENLKAEYDALIAKKKLTKEEYNRAKELQAELNNLYEEINILVNQYNKQVDSYNVCIKT